MSQPPLIELLYEALAEEIGVIVETNSPDRLRQKLYAIRKEDKALKVISLVTVPNKPTELWLIKKPKEAENAEEI